MLVPPPRFVFELPVEFFDELPRLRFRIEENREERLGGVGGATESSVKPLNRGEQVRVFVKGACAMGDLLCAADPSTAADKGKLRKLPTTAGTYAVLAIAEEAGVDGQAVLARAYNKSVTVASS